MPRKTTARHKPKGKRNIDPLSAMALAQGTGVDRVVFGKRGFGEVGRAIQGKRNPVKEFYFREMTPPGTPEHKRQFRLYTRTGQYGKFGQTDNMGVQGLEWTRASYAKKGYVEVPPQSDNPDGVELFSSDAPIPSEGHIEFTPDGIERYVRDGYVYQAFTATPVFEDGFRMGTPESTVNDFAIQNPAKYERCVRAVQRRGGANGYAVCAKLRNPSRRRNPEDEANVVYEEFHGIPPQETLEYHEKEHVHENLAGLGDLICIVVKLTGGKKIGSKVELKAPDPSTARESDIVRLACNEAKNQLYFVAGDQSVDVQALGFRESYTVTHDGEDFDATDLRDRMVLGQVCKLTYRTQKSFDNFEDIDYYHRVGEDTGEKPFLIYDTLNQKMSLAGGGYTVDAKGVVN